MEEKERYGITDAHYLCDSAIFDTETNDILRLYQICDLLNHYFKRIKELEKQLAESEADKKALISDYDSRITKHQELISWLEHNNEELKQQLHELPKKIVEDIEKNFTEYLPLKYKTGAGFYSRLNAILKKYGGEDE